MRILGVDPGSRHTGYGCVDREGTESTMVASGRITTERGAPLPDRLLVLADGIDTVVTDLQPDVAALETPFHGINARSLIVLCQARGALVTALARRQIPIEEFSPAEVKSAVTGNGRAAKSQVNRMVRMLLGLDDDGLSEDAADALAVALCHAARQPLRRAVRRADAEPG